MGGSPSVPDPAKRPERVVEVDAEDIILGNDELETPDRPRGGRGGRGKAGRAGLTKPSGGTSGIKVN